MHIAVRFVKQNQVLYTYWARDLEQALLLKAWFNNLPRHHASEKQQCVACLEQVKEAPTPYQAWVDNCAAEQLCLSFRDVGIKTVYPYTRPEPLRQEAPILSDTRGSLLVFVSS